MTKTVENCERMRCCESRRESAIACEDCIIKDTACHTRKGLSMAYERNALAELAELLAVTLPHVEVAVGCEVYSVDKHLTCAKVKAAIAKASRIVAELAKFTETNYFEASESQMFETLTNCRAIAEEGAGDGK